MMKKRLPWPRERMDFRGLYFLTYMFGAMVVSLACLPELGAAAGALVLFPFGLINLGEKVEAGSILGYVLVLLYPILATIGILTRSRAVYALFVMVVVINIGGCFAGP